MAKSLQELIKYYLTLKAQLDDLHNKRDRLDEVGAVSEADLSRLQREVETLKREYVSVLGTPAEEANRNQLEAAEKSLRDTRKRLDTSRALSGRVSVPEGLLLDIGRVRQSIYFHLAAEEAAKLPEESRQILRRAWAYACGSATLYTQGEYLAEVVGLLAPTELRQLLAEKSDELGL